VSKRYEKEDNHGVKQYLSRYLRGGYSTAAIFGITLMATPSKVYTMLGDSDKKIKKDFVESFYIFSM